MYKDQLSVNGSQYIFTLLQETYSLENSRNQFLVHTAIHVDKSTILCELFSRSFGLAKTSRSSWVKVQRDKWNNFPCTQVANRINVQDGICTGHESCLGRISIHKVLILDSIIGLLFPSVKPYYKNSPSNFFDFTTSSIRTSQQFAIFQQETCVGVER